MFSFLRYTLVRWIQITMAVLRYLLIYFTLVLQSFIKETRINKCLGLVAYIIYIYNNLPSSILGAGSIIVCACLKRLVRKPRGKPPSNLYTLWIINNCSNKHVILTTETTLCFRCWPLFLLSVTDLLLALSWMCGGLLFTQSCKSYAICYTST